jgi:hypothetical protein
LPPRRGGASRDRDHGRPGDPTRSILFAAKLGGILAVKLKLPAVLGELIAGVIIGPYALGAIPPLRLPHGSSPWGTGGLAVSTELYGFATVPPSSSFRGGPGDRPLALPALLRGRPRVGLGASSPASPWACFSPSGPWTSDRAIPRPCSWASSPRHLGRHHGADPVRPEKKDGHPEGCDHPDGGVFDDVLGIICLAVVMAWSRSWRAPPAAAWAGRASWASPSRPGHLAGLHLLGLLLSKQLARFLTVFKQPTTFSILSLGLALLLAGFFETEGWP